MDQFGAYHLEVAGLDASLGNEVHLASEHLLQGMRQVDELHADRRVELRQQVHIAFGRVQPLLTEPNNASSLLGNR